jgi:hypothetical protein
LDVAAQEGKDTTLKSKISERKATQADTPGTAIDLDSTLERKQVPNLQEGERNRNLNEIFKDMDPGAGSATIGSRVGEV